MAKVVNTKPKQRAKVKTAIPTSEQILSKTYIKRRKALVTLATK